MKRSKKYTKVLAKFDKTKRYDVEEAMKLLPELSFSKFAGSIEINIFLNLNDKQKKESIRGAYTLPNSFGKEVKVLVICDTNDEKKAAGADFFGGEDLIAEIAGGKADFDVVITTPGMMPKLARLSKVLGPKGMMPNPKNGTITTDLETTIKTFKSGKKHFKATEVGLISAVIGKTDMGNEKLKENFDALIKAIFAEVKKFNPNPFKTITMAPTMGPKLIVDVNKISL